MTLCTPWLSQPPPTPRTHVFVCLLRRLVAGVSGIMLVGSQAGQRVRVAKDVVKEELIAAGAALRYWEPEFIVSAVFAGRHACRHFPAHAAIQGGGEGLRCASGTGMLDRNDWKSPISARRKHGSSSTCEYSFGEYGRMQSLARVGAIAVIAGVICAWAGAVPVQSRGMRRGNPGPVVHRVRGGGVA